eukprot:1112635-Amorphochlora_amoeboformis.AAC.2
MVKGEALACTPGIHFLADYLSVDIGDDAHDLGRLDLRDRIRRSRGVWYRARLYAVTVSFWYPDSQSGPAIASNFASVGRVLVQVQFPPNVLDLTAR